MLDQSLQTNGDSIQWHLRTKPEGISKYVYIILITYLYMQRMWLQNSERISILWNI